MAFLDFYIVSLVMLLRNFRPMFFSAPIEDLGEQRLAQESTRGSNDFRFFISAPKMGTANISKLLNLLSTVLNS